MSALNGTAAAPGGADTPNPSDLSSEDKRPAYVTVLLAPDLRSDSHARTRGRLK